MPLTEGTRLGSYEVTSAIGAGGMGEVYRARDSRLGRDVAIKVLPQAFASDGERLARFVREARTLASLNHPNIAQIYGLEDSGGLPALVMELVEGPTLGDRIAQGPLPLEETLRIARELADALDTAHSRGIVHRDLKPANIKLDADRTVKVLDFGLAKLTEKDSTGDQTTGIGAALYDSPTLGFPVKTGIGTILGTAAYMSPEQARGRVVDKRADIWAFGVILYEMLTGTRPFSGEDASETIAAVLKETPSWEGVPYLVRPLVQSCLEKDPRRRLRDIGDMWRVLDPARGESGQIAANTLTGGRWIPWAIAGAAALALAGTAMFFVTRPTPQLPAARFTVDAPPPSSTFRFEVTGASVSPDGTMVVFSAFNPAGNALYLRRIDSLDTTPLPGTENADLPFWSPDGRSIAFFANGSLKRIELAGGPPVTVSPSLDAFGGTWNRDGVILFATAAGISRVSASGGDDPVVVLKPKEPGWHIGHPQFLPDQDHFVYYTRDARGQEREIRGSSMSTPERDTRILGEGYQARYVPPLDGGPGHLLYLRDLTLMAQPFDPTALRLSGTAEAIAESVMVLRTDSAAFSVSDTGVLAYRAGELATERSKLLWVDRAGTVLSEVAPVDFYSSLRISPDGTRAALGRRNIIRQDDQWVLDFGRGASAMTRLTFDAARETWPVWSPDGTEVAFGANPTGQYELYRKAASGAGSQTQFTPATSTPTAGAGKRPSDWSRDGRYLIYTDTDPMSGDNIWALRVDVNPSPVIEVRKTSFEEFDGHLSPDGRWIAYISNESGREEVFIQSFMSDSARTQVSSQGGRAPRWHPNGRELFYYNDESGYLLSVPVEVVNGAIKTGTPRPLFVMPLPRGVTAPWDISPDGRRFLMQQLQPRPARPPLTVVTYWPATRTR